MAVSNSCTRSLQARQWAECAKFTSNPFSSSITQFEQRRILHGKTSSIIGAAVGRVEGADKVSGQAIYGADVHFADTLWGKILRSPYPHARIIRHRYVQSVASAGRESDRHRQRRAGALSGQKHSRHSGSCAGTKCVTSATRSRRWRRRAETRQKRRSISSTSNTKSCRRSSTCSKR